MKTGFVSYCFTTLYLSRTTCDHASALYQYSPVVIFICPCYFSYLCYLFCCFLVANPLLQVNLNFDLVAFYCCLSAFFV